MKYPLAKMRRFAHFPTPVFAVAFALALALAPFRAAAQTPAPAPGASPVAASAPSSSSAASQAPKSAEEQEQAFLHSSVVQSLARILHLSLDTTIDLLLGINFAIIFLAVAIPIGRLMPKIVRKRSQTLRHDFETAREATAEAQARLSAVEAKLAGLGEEIQKFRAQVEQESLEDEQRIKAALGEESARIVAAAEQEIDVAASQARRALRSFAADLAIDQAAKQMAVTPETDRALIAEFIAGAAADASGKGGSN
ncbi:MAG: ATP synthase F0 subunit B [Terracidiphilus sp.]